MTPQQIASVLMRLHITPQADRIKILTQEIKQLGLPIAAHAAAQQSILNDFDQGIMLISSKTFLLRYR
ncbi:hypothetical protein [Pedobacter sp. BMA]|uniref:hypothetical protein n=1 Tax=Pedobacter sp. BMA TaxID=1663685 RepID=UPI00064A583C|nr:hypothetical protein [Pedobacter sp. BMA]KLT64749.1 hypothetical protein AB669_13475 [Pedobacter sp. BMA]